MSDYQRFCLSYFHIYHIVIPLLSFWRFHYQHSVKLISFSIAIHFVYSQCETLQSCIVWMHCMHWKLLWKSILFEQCDNNYNRNSLKKVLLKSQFEALKNCMYVFYKRILRNCLPVYCTIKLWKEMCAMKCSKKGGNPIQSQKYFCVYLPHRKTVT